MCAIETLQLEGRLGFAVEIARLAGEQTLKLLRAPNLGLELKADGSPVTRADREAETLLRKLIGERFPEDGILGEEYGEVAGTSDYQWILDPIDGTKSFVAGVPLYTTLVAVMHGEKSEIGVINAPAAGEIVFAERGKGCWHVHGAQPPQPARVSSVSHLADAVFLTTAVSAFSTGRERDCRGIYDQLQAACRLTRTWGDAFGYLLVATGRAEVMIDPVMNLWDAAALEPVITEAGGSFTDWRGQPTVHSGEAVATNRALAEEVLRIVAEHG